MANPQLTVRFEGLGQELKDFREFSISLQDDLKYANIWCDFSIIMNPLRSPHVNKYSNLLSDSGPVAEFSEINLDAETIGNGAFIIDPGDFVIKWDPALHRYVVRNQGKDVAHLEPNKRYRLVIGPRLNGERQREDLLFKISPPIEPPLVYNICLEDEVNNTKIAKFVSELSEIFTATHKGYKIEALIGNDYVEVEYNSLILGKLEEKLESEPVNPQGARTFPFLNFMNFRLKKPEEEPSDLAVPFSFDALLKDPGRIEKDRLKSYIQTVHRLQKANNSFFQAPFVNVCQSSGSGKSKIAAELTLEVPSCLVVLRSTLPNAPLGYPFMSTFSKLFLDIPTKLPEDANKTTDLAYESIVGRYLLLVKALLSDYLDKLGNLLNSKSLNDALKDLYISFVEGTFLGNDLAVLESIWSSISSKSWEHVFVNDVTGKFDSGTDKCIVSPTMKEVAKACDTILEKIDQLYKSKSPNSQSFPFVLTVDEASLLASKCTTKEISFFRLFRRAISRLPKNSKIVVLTLGTNSDVLDLNPEISDDSRRLDAEARMLFPPFLLLRNWDIFFQIQEMLSKPVRYDTMVLGRMMLFWMSLGRPLWSSISFCRLIPFIVKKISNNSLETGEAYLAFWMVRVGLLVHPAHIVTKHLVKSLMATLIYTSHDLRSMRAYYPSEPALAVGVRSLLINDLHVEKYYESLEKFVNLRAIDSGRFTEIISGDISLQAIAKANKVKCNWDKGPDVDAALPEVCKAKNFIFENDSFHLQRTAEDVRKMQEDGSSVSDLKSLEENYMIVQVDKFVLSMYGKDVFKVIEALLPASLKSARLNASHFTQMGLKFPFEVLSEAEKQEFEYTEAPVADPESSKKDKSCSQVTSEILQALITRGSGAMFAPNTFGLDYQIPVCLEPESNLSNADLTTSMERLQVDPRKPEYSFVGVQVKRGKISNIRPIVAMGAMSNHYVRCGRHGAKCPEANCKFRLSDATYERILKNGLIIVHAMEERESTDTDAAVENAVDSESESVPKKTKLEKYEKIVFESSLVQFKELFAKLTLLKAQLKEKEIENADYNKKKDEIESQFKALAREFCPEEFRNRIDRFQFKPFKAETYKDCRFVPDFYFGIHVSPAVSVHVMFKMKPDGGVQEKLTAIYSKGLNVFSNVLPPRAITVANRIIFNENSIFDEIPAATSDGKLPIKYTEMISGVVSRNNGASIPVASNFIRAMYELEEMPNLLPDYNVLDQDTIYKEL